MQFRRNAVVTTVIAATCLALTVDAPLAGGEPGFPPRLRCWLAPSLAVCRDLARERENRALEAVENEPRSLSRRLPLICFDPGSETNMPCPP
ncbi:MAG: hypothetical protein Q8O26_11820 [Phreatobacter sp.]|uniref:hypothetical protein n=1 Tax=Phreatobacter sp. TaxID=1966341 RepID=UPI002735DE27|nr:hypothetical protein [Phreatobacter sp.]MDP2802560.1 hypothetical protein [Phreatobacter sp.]